MTHTIDNNEEERDDSIDETEDDVVLERDNEYTPKEPAEVIAKLRLKLKACEQEKQEYLDGWQRAKADFINARKQEELSRKELVTFSNEHLISDLIPVLDSFDMAMGNKVAWEQAPKEWRMGIEYIYTQFLSILSQSGLLQQTSEPGHVFDPRLHEAVDTMETNEKEKDGQIFQILQKGYSLNGKPIRSIKVKVQKYTALNT